MKFLLVLFLLFIESFLFAQSKVPDFLEGTWKMENQDIYEHWDKLNDYSMKGFSYKVKDGEMKVSEYIDITYKNGRTIYTATVIRQNQGKGVDFTATVSDSMLIFENPEHDFPKKIVYKILSDTEISIMISDGDHNGPSYKIIKQNTTSPAQDTTGSNPLYDKYLAKKLGADDYGMKGFYLVILKTGTNTSADKELVSESFRGHLDNIGKLVKEGKIVVAGPLGKNERNYRGIFILNNIASIEEANELLQSDPAIKNGLLDVEVYNWYGSAALPEYLPYSDKIWRSKP